MAVLLVGYAVVKNGKLVGEAIVLRKIEIDDCDVESVLAEPACLQVPDDLVAGDYQVYGADVVSWDAPQ